MINIYTAERRIKGRYANGEIFGYRDDYQEINFTINQCGDEKSKRYRLGITKSEYQEAIAKNKTIIEQDNQ